MSLSQLAEMTVVALGIASAVTAVLVPILAAIAYLAWVRTGKSSTGGTGVH